MVSTCPVISKYSSPFNNPLVTVPKVPITISIIVTFMFHSFSIIIIIIIIIIILRVFTPVLAGGFLLKFEWL